MSIKKFYNLGPGIFFHERIFAADLDAGLDRDSNAMLMSTFCMTGPSQTPSVVYDTHKQRCAQNNISCMQKMKITCLYQEIQHFQAQISLECYFSCS